MFLTHALGSFFTTQVWLVARSTFRIKQYILIDNIRNVDDVYGLVHLGASGAFVGEALGSLLRALRCFPCDRCDFLGPLSGLSIA